MKTNIIGNLIVLTAACGMLTACGIYKSYERPDDIHAPGQYRMDNMAKGITHYVADHDVKIPIFTRMCGTMEEEGLRIMKEAGLETYYDLTETAMKLRKAVKGV